MALCSVLNGAARHALQSKDVQCTNYTKSLDGFMHTTRSRLIEKHQSKITKMNYEPEVYVPKQLTFLNVVAISSMSDNDPTPEPWKMKIVFKTLGQNRCIKEVRPYTRRLTIRSSIINSLL